MLWAANQFIRKFSTATVYYQNKLRLALIGQSVFGQEVYRSLRKEGHKIVGVFTVPDNNGKADPLAVAAEKDGTPVFKFPRWRLKGKSISEVVDAYKSVGAELNVLPFCSQFIPMDVIDHPKHGSIIYHPSILPRHRGASAINWTLIDGDKKAGFSVFWADEGLDTGPILLQRVCDVEPNDTVDSLYNRFLFPEGIKAMVEAVQLIADGKAPRIDQPEDGATYEGIQKKENAKIYWDSTAEAIHNWIRGHDKVPGAWTAINDQLIVKNLQFEDGKMIPASNYFSRGESTTLELTDEEKNIESNIRDIWKGILTNVAAVEDTTDFFKSGAASMDVVRLVEEIKQKCNGIELHNEDVYMATTFQDFIQMVVRKFRGEDKEELVIDYVSDFFLRLADLMEEHQEELATIEALDSGAVYTLALKTHVGMSVQTFRYFAGWCDKIQGTTIPINQARPNRNLTFTKKEPLGVCAIVIPWNYPLMMLAWKSAACLAAGNTLVLKPAQVTPLTALKFAELSIKAGVPKGVINILPGSEIKKMKIGDPLDRSTDHGPQNHKAHLDKLLEYCETGVKEGATLVFGARQVPRPGFFMEPTVFTNVEDHMYIAQEESFGPVMVISKFKDGDVEGVLARANSTEYGLASGVFTKDISKAMYVSEKLEAGTVFINTYNKTDVAAPFGGFKQSGFGKDLGEEALHEYLRTKAVTVEY
uniref:formyltetrahydrofolate dehydrogenase n=1 Tax=Pyxicephalus adspersus TaxID=30357 RepID=A0AAV3AUV2_PYXAD|nr:TPA: hypothetical protein GDO54_006918 [Pyxicephalus adspersus]